MPEYKVETLYSGTEVGVYILGTQCLNTAPFCAGAQALVLRPPSVSTASDTASGPYGCGCLSQPFQGFPLSLPFQFLSDDKARVGVVLVDPNNLHI